MRILPKEKSKKSWGGRGGGGGGECADTKTEKTSVNNNTNRTPQLKVTGKDSRRYLQLPACGEGGKEA